MYMYASLTSLETRNKFFGSSPDRRLIGARHEINGSLLHLEPRRDLCPMHSVKVSRKPTSNSAQSAAKTSYTIAFEDCKCQDTHRV